MISIDSVRINMMNSGSLTSPTSSSSRRSRMRNSHKRKQPQRGLGVAQLEKIRLHEEMGCCFHILPSTSFIHAYPSTMEPPSSSSSSSLQWSLSSSASDYDIQPTTATSWRRPNKGMADRHQFSEPNISHQQFLHPNLQDSRDTRRTLRLMGNSLMVSSSRKSEWSETSEGVDLELRLSL
ncbi:hypothetical protein SAY87_005617 [Trapa incisa]|uniref:Uncharacterized protein n=1 Tax=Trapa incisa TaxID=236973 RepID=A0AAN7K943_9MYRT|nr:hypothetical protein SAY87_005617 [Trapa incisa]